MQGHPWHIGYVKAKDERRHKARCIKYSPKNLCKIYGKCIGSSQCSHYGETPEKKRTLGHNETYQPKNKTESEKSNARGIKAGDTVELLDSINDFRLKVHIVKKGKAYLKEKKISVDSPMGKAIVGKQIGDLAEVFIERKVIYEIVGWVKR